MVNERFVRLNEARVSLDSTGIIGRSKQVCSAWMKEILIEEKG